MATEPENADLEVKTKGGRRFGFPPYMPASKKLESLAQHLIAHWHKNLLKVNVLSQLASRFFPEKQEVRPDAAIGQVKFAGLGVKSGL